MTKKVLSIVLSLVMLLGMVPFAGLTAFAADIDISGSYSSDENVTYTVTASFTGYGEEDICKVTCSALGINNLVLPWYGYYDINDDNRSVYSDAIKGAIGVPDADLTLNSAPVFSYLDPSQTYRINAYIYNYNGNKFFVELQKQIVGGVAWTIQGPHTHFFSDKWSFDANGHWHACKAKCCTVTSGFSSHTSDGFAYAQHTGMSDFICDNCEYNDVTGAATAAKAELAAAKTNAVSDEAKAAIDAAIENVDKATTVAGVESAKSAGTANADAADEALAKAISEAKSALDLENAKDPLDNDESVATGKQNIENAKSLTEVSSAKSTAIGAIQTAQAAERAIVMEDALAALTEKYAEASDAVKKIITDNESTITGATTKDAVAAAVEAIEAEITVQLAREGAAAEIENEIAQYTYASDTTKKVAEDAIAALSGLNTLDAIAAAVEQAKADIADAYAKDVGAAIEAAADEIRAAIPEDASDATKQAAEEAIVKEMNGLEKVEDVPAAKQAALKAVEEAYELDLAAAREEAAEKVNNEIPEDATTPVYDKANELLDQLKELKSVMSIMGMIPSMKNAVKQAYEEAVAAAKEVAKQALEEQFDFDPIDDKATLNAAKTAVDGANTISDIENALNNGIASIKAAQKVALDAAKKDAADKINGAINENSTQYQKAVAGDAHKKVADAETKAEVKTATDKAVKNIETYAPCDHHVTPFCEIYDQFVGIPIFNMIFRIIHEILHAVKG